MMRIYFLPHILLPKMYLSKDNAASQVLRLARHLGGVAVDPIPHSDGLVGRQGKGTIVHQGYSPKFS